MRWSRADEPRLLRIGRIGCRFGLTWARALGDGNETSSVDREGRAGAHEMALLRIRGRSEMDGGGGRGPEVTSEGPASADSATGVSEEAVAVDRLDFNLDWGDFIIGGFSLTRSHGSS